MATMTRKDYAAMYGPTTGDLVRLGDTVAAGRGRARPRRLWRGVRDRRRQDAARRHGHRRRPSPRRRRHRHGHRQRPRHRCGRRHRQGRHRHQGRQDRRHRQGRQSAHHGRRRSAPHRRTEHAGPHRRGHDRHRRRLRRACAFRRHRPVRPCALERHHHHARRRARPGLRRRLRRPLDHRADAARGRRLRHEFRLLRPRQLAQAANQSSSSSPAASSA